MFRPFRTRSARRGNTLIVTLSCLSLLAVVGLTAVYFTGDQATRSRLQGQTNYDDEFADKGMGALNAYLSGLNYGRQNFGQDLLAADRGHDLLRAMYSGQPGSIIAWDGVGTFDQATTIPEAAATPIQRRLIVNHRLFPGMTGLFDPEFAGQRLPTDPPPAYVGNPNFIPKNAAYTYPDLKDFYLGYLNPATGEVLVSSYHRAAAFGSLDPSNPNWTNAPGKYLTPRPRPAEHTNFPPVPANADGTYTGDVRNFPGGYFYDPNTGQHVARNDSIWIDIGLPAFTLPNGRRVKPLVAPLIIDLDSLLNLQVHGNAMGTGATHGSNQGWGRWEVSLQKVLGAEGQAIVSARGNQPAGTAPINQTRAGQLARTFDPRLPIGPPAQQLPSYSAVAWTGGTAAGSMSLPGFGTSMFAIDPTYNAASFSSTNTTIPSHAALFNINEWPSGTGNALRTFALADTMILKSRHAGTAGYYSTLDVGASAPNSLRGGPLATPPYPPPFPNPPQQTTTNGRRMDPAHVVRGITTTFSASLDRTALTPGSGQTQALAGVIRANGLAGVDLNRRLADYRLVSTQALSPANLAAQSVTVGTQLVRQAEADRQFFCRDIFARLIVANNVPATDATVDTAGNVTISPTVTPGTLAFNNLRSLAQIAANICDYRDEDEISTPFVWNPLVVIDPFNPLNFTPTAPDVIGNHVVFGVEKTRLEINEAYAEQVNNPADGAGMPTQANHVRFWIELLNPGTTGAGPLDDGGAQLYEPLSTISPYRIEIARFTRPGATGVEDLGSYLDPTLHPENVTGSFDPAYAPEIQFTFDATTATAGKQRVLPNAAVYDPAGNPAQGVALIAPTITMAKTSEFNPLAPVMGVVPPPWINALQAALPTGQTLNNAMAYQAGTMPAAAADANRADYKRHVVLLRRLANPHLPESAYNPYITVDYVDGLHAHDAILRLMGQNTDRTAGAGGYTDFPNRYAIGKVQPQAGLSVSTAPVAPAVDPTHVFPTSMVVDQNPATPVMGQPKHTFGRHNGVNAVAPVAATYALGPPATITDTIMAPFDWLPHMDRLLINQMELLHVTTSKPHLLTQQFIIPDPVIPGAIRKHASSLFTGASLTSPLFTTQMYRTLELLSIHGHGEGDPLHGRRHGLININTISDKRVWDSLFDAQAGNVFTQAQVDAMWNALITSRTVSMQQRYNTLGQPLTDTTGFTPANPVLTPVPGATIYDNNSAVGDRPFLPYGVSTIAIAPGGSPLAGGTATAFGGGQGIDDTILRRINLTTNVIDPTQSPAIFQILQNAGITHPYQQAEALRKIQNNFTTRSNTFAVWVTVGYFDVESEVDSIIPLPTGGFAKHVTLGNEYYRKVSADTRHQFFAIIDRSNVGLDPVNFATNVYTHATTRPFFTTVEATANVGSPTIDIATDLSGQVYADGVTVPINPTSSLVIGVGASQEIAIVNSLITTANDPTTGRMVTRYQLAAPLTKNHYAGECVSNVVSGNPGPPPWAPVAPATNPLQFDVNDPTFRPVIPLWSRIQ